MASHAAQLLSHIVVGEEVNSITSSVTLHMVLGPFGKGGEIGASIKPFNKRPGASGEGTEQW